MAAPWKKWDHDGLIRHSILVMLFTNSIGALNLFFHVVMGWTLPKEEYGVLVPMLGIMLLLTTPMTAVSNTLAHFAAHLRASGHAGDIRPLVRHWLLKILAVAVPLLLLALATRHPLAGFFHLGGPGPIVMVALTMFLSVFVPVLSGALQGMQSFVWMSLTANIWGLFRFVLGWAAVLWLAPLALWGLAAHGLGMLGSLAAGLVGLWLVVPRGAPSGQPLEKADRYFFMSLLPLFCFSALMNADVILVKHFIPDAAQVGRYSRASTIARTMIFLAQPIVQAMFPKVVSLGTWSAAHARTLLRALLLAGLIIGGVLLVCVLFPAAPLLLMFKERAPAALDLNLVRGVCLAMTPLGLTLILMNFELAQQRFACNTPLVICALAYIGGVVLFHRRLEDIILVLAAVSLAALGSLLWLFWRRSIRRGACNS